MPYLLDTNILLNFIRGTNKPLVEKIDKIISDENVIYISFASVAEIRSIAYRNNWGKNKISFLNKVFDMLEVIHENDEIIDNYVEIDVFSQGKHKITKSTFSARNMGKNDLWIASTAKYLDLTLITTDNDFQHLEPDFINILKL